MMGITAAHIHLQGDVAGLAAVHLAAHHPLGVLDGDAALGVLDEHDEHHDGQHTNDDEDGAPPGEIKDALAGDAVEVVLDAGVDGGDHAGYPGQDAGKQNDGNAVADAELGDLLTQPHDKGGTRR